MKIKIALADDHVLLRHGLASLLKELGFDVLFEADNGSELLQKIETHSLPDVVLMDINMPLMNGFETTLLITKKYPAVRVLALSMYDDENTIIRMLRNGAKGYILKDSEPAELKQAILSVNTKGFYHSELVSGTLLNIVNHLDDPSYAGLKESAGLSDKEIEFLKFLCTDLTYKEIADQMDLSPRTIDGYRDLLFEKIKVKSRVSLVIYAIKNGIVLL